MTLKSHGVAAACKAASSGFDSHRRLDAIQLLARIPSVREDHGLNRFLAGRVVLLPQLPVGTTPL